MTPSRAAIERLAGEYVLGTLRGPARRRFARLLDEDPHVRAEVDAWNRRLAPLERAATPVPPPTRVLARLNATLDGDSKPVKQAPPWRALAAGLAFLCFVLAGVLALRDRPDAPVAIAVLHPSAGAAGWVVQADGHGALRVEALAPGDAGDGRVYELWLRRAGSDGVRSLGLVSATPGEIVRLQADDAVVGAELLITREPAGGAPNGKPTGAPIFRATLQPV
ncbi:anti-sigma factor [Roseiterribacter gracilis]|uniref:DNA-directed RNA polymerase sigma-70 factor n=1 Tax=Roseiterribacter gracilis TaxID=2812848 RepID=A0A8S8X7T6_9PROT|nr:DNA-directed RNA polymerase sigma-70 factor [Rhodospirillales bacterium TMPK1]